MAWAMIQGTETVTVIRKTFGEYDEFGLPTSTTVETEIKGVLVSWNGSSTIEELNRTFTQSDVTFYFPAGTVIKASDTFRYLGAEWEKQGVEQRWTAPAGFTLVPGVVVNANRIEG
jgi:hypothetical protein